jgi:hypothetical protein
VYDRVFLLHPGEMSDVSHAYTRDGLLAERVSDPGVTVGGGIGGGIGGVVTAL